MDPFDPAIEVSPPEPARRVDAGRAIRVGVGQMIANFGSVIAAALILSIVYIVSVCSCVLWVFTMPWMMLTVARWALSVVDGEADLALLWLPVINAPVTLWLRGWGYILLTGCVYFPTFLLGLMVGLLTVDAGPVEMSIYEVVSEIPNIVWFMVVAPYQLFCFYVAEQRNTVLGSVGQAWRELRSSWGPLALLAVGIQLLFAPSGVILAYVTAWSDTVPANQIDGLALGFGLLFVAWVGLLVGAATTEFILAAAYRQIHPAAPEEPV